MNTIRPDNKEIENIVITYSDMLFRLCFAMLRSNADAEDAVSDVILKYMTSSKNFTSEEHKKAWLLRVASNVCRDMLRFYKRRNHLSLDDIAEYCQTDENISITAELMMLPLKYRSVIYLHYIEGYKTAEIAKILSITPAAVRKRLQYGREMLKIELREDGCS